MDQMVDFLMPQLPKDYPCGASASVVNDCIQPFVAPLSAAGANLMALINCDRKELASRLSKKVTCK